MISPLVKVLLILAFTILLGFLIIPRLSKKRFRIEGAAVPVAASSHVHPHDHKNVIIIVAMTLLMVVGLIAVVMRQIADAKADREQQDSDSDSGSDTADALVTQAQSMTTMQQDLTQIKQQQQQPQIQPQIQSQVQPQRPPQQKPGLVGGVINAVNPMNRVSSVVSSGKDMVDDFSKGHVADGMVSGLNAASGGLVGDTLGLLGINI